MKLVKFRGIAVVVSDFFADNMDVLEQVFKSFENEFKVELIQERGYDGAGIRLKCSGENYFVEYEIEQANRMGGINNLEVLIAKIYKKNYGVDKVPELLKGALDDAELIELQTAKIYAKSEAESAKKLFDEIRENKMIQNALDNKAEQDEKAQADTRAKKVTDFVMKARKLAEIAITAAARAEQSNDVDVAKAAENDARQALYRLQSAADGAKSAAAEMLPSEVSREKAARAEADRLADEQNQQLYKQELEKQRLEKEKLSNIDCSGIADHMLPFEFRKTLQNGKYPGDVLDSPHVKEALFRVIKDESKSYLIGNMAGRCADKSQKEKLFDVKANPKNYSKDIIASSTKSGPSI